MKKNQQFLVIDDLAFCLHTHPVYLPIPSVALKDEKALKAFTMKSLRALMRLDVFDWYHDIRDVHLDGFVVRGSCVYPDFST